MDGKKNPTITRKMPARMSLFSNISSPLLARLRRHSAGKSHADAFRLCELLIRGLSTNQPGLPFCSAARSALGFARGFIILIIRVRENLEHEDHFSHFDLIAFFEVRCPADALTVHISAVS